MKIAEIYRYVYLFILKLMRLSKKTAPSTIWLK